MDESLDNHVESMVNLTLLDESNFDHQLSDSGNAARFADRYKDNLIFVPEFGVWYVWNGKYWERDNGSQVPQMAMLVANAIAREAESEADLLRKQKILHWSANSLSEPRLNSMIKLAKSMRTVSASKLDKGKMLLNVNNGTLDLETGKLLPHNPAHLITRIIPIDYSSNDAKAERWERFLQEIFPGDPELIRFVQRAVGLSALGRRERVLFVCEGHGANGKSVLLDTVSRVLGEYGERISSDILLTGKFEANGQAPTPELAKLKGKRFVVASETNSGRELNSALIKSLTGDELRTAREPHGMSFTYIPEDTFWLQTNHLPKVGDGEIAVHDRIVRIPFRRRFTDDKQDRNLLDKLRGEQAGILAWIVEGAKLYLESGLGTCQTVKMAGETYQLQSDSIKGFIKYACDLVPDNPKARTDIPDLYNHYLAFCQSVSIKGLPQARFKSQLEEVYELDQGKSGSSRYWKGIQVRQSWLSRMDSDSLQDTPYDPPTSPGVAASLAIQ